MMLIWIHPSWSASSLANCTGLAKLFNDGQAAIPNSIMIILVHSTHYTELSILSRRVGVCWTDDHDTWWTLNHDSDSPSNIDDDRGQVEQDRLHLTDFGKAGVSAGLSFKKLVRKPSSTRISMWLPVGIVFSTLVYVLPIYSTTVNLRPPLS